MKLVSLLLLIYFAGLSVMPCSDMANLKFDSCESEILASSNEHNHSDDQNDSCTPFCVCTCCSSLTRIVKGHSISEVKITFSIAFIPSRTFDYSFEYNEGVWRPPAVC